MKLQKSLVVALALVVASCSDDEVVEEQQIDYAAFDNAAVQALFDAGEYEQVFQIVRAQDELNIADKEDFIILADVFLTMMNGVGAEVALEKAKEAEAEDSEIVLRLAKALTLQGKHDEALLAIGDIVLTGDDAYEALLLRGDVHSQLNEVDRARHFFNAAVEDQPDNYRGYLGMALLELNQGNLELAEQLAEQASGYVDEDPIVRYVRGTAARYLLKVDTAIEHLTKAIELHPAHILANLELAGIYIDKREYETAQKYLDFVYGLSPDHSMARYYSALILASENKLEEAENLLLRIGDMTRTFPPASRVYGHVAFQLGKFSTAQPYLERFLAMVPEDRITRLALAESQARRGEPGEALETLTPLLAEDNQDMEALMQAASAAGLSGDMLNALDYISRAKAIADKNGEGDQELLKTLGKRLALTRFMTGDLERAAEQLRALYGEDTSDLTSLILLANIQMEGGDLPGAEETIAQIMEIQPEEPISNNLMGAIKFRQGNTEEAIDFYSKAIDKNPEYLSALKNRGLAYVSSRQFEKALPDLVQVNKGAPSDAHVQGMLGRTYLELEQIDKAIEHLTFAESVFPKSAIVLSDHSEALAAKGFMQSAIIKAKRARTYAAGQDDFVEYLNNIIDGWEAAEAERKAAEAAEEERLREEYLKQKAEREKARAEKKAAEEAEEAAAEAERAAQSEDEDKSEEDEDPPSLL